MEDELKRIQIENYELYDAINILKNLEQLFLPITEDTEVILKNATENKKIIELKDFIQNNHKEFLTEEDFQKFPYELQHIPDQPDYFDTFTVYDLLVKARIVINRKIKGYTKEIFGNNKLLSQTVQKVSNQNIIEEDKKSGRGLIVNYLTKEKIDVSKIENVTSFSKELRQKLDLKITPSSIRRFIQDLRSEK